MLKIANWYWFLGCFLVVQFTVCVTTQAQVSPLEGVDSVVESAISEAGIPGLAVLVVKDDSVMLSRGYGVRRIGSNEGIDSHTLFQVASLTKAVTATALAMLVDEGSLNWDDPIQKYLPEFALADPWVSRHFTIRDALAMRSGIASGDTLALFSDRSRPEILAAMPHLEAPGFRTGYGAAPNLMYFLAGEVVRASSGMSWDRFVQDRIFDALGMAETTTIFYDGATHPQLASPHERKNGQPVPREPVNVDNVAAAGGTFTCIADWAQWVRFHLAGGVFEGQRLLNQEALDETYRPQNILSPAYQSFFNPDALLNAYGFGWVVSDYQGRRLIEHAGALPGFSAVIALMPDENVGVVLLSNLDFQATLPTLLSLKFNILDRFIEAD